MVDPAVYNPNRLIEMDSNGPFDLLNVLGNWISQSGGKVEGKVP